MGTRRIDFKMAAATDNPLFLQASSLWKMLDELADNNPDGYTEFMDKFLKHNQECWKPPEPVFCFKTHKLPESSNHHFFINICKWDQVLPLSKQKERIPVVASELRELLNCSTKTSVIDICFNSDVMTELGDVNECQQVVSKMAIEYVENQAGCKLSEAYKVLTIKYKGNKENLKMFLFKLNRKSTSPVETPADNEKQSILHGLSNIVKPQGMKKDPSGLLEDPGGSAGYLKVGGDGSNATKKPLIEELSPAAVVEATQVPKHTIEVVKATACSPGHIVVKVDLPKVCSGSECKLDVSKDDLVLFTPHYSKLHVRLQERGDEDNTSSTFNKMTHQLTVTIPVLLR